MRRHEARCDRQLAANAGISLRRSSGCAAAMITTMGGFDERIIMEGNRGRPGDQPCRRDPRNGRPRRTEERRVRKECVHTFHTWCSTYHYKKNTTYPQI